MARVASGGGVCPVRTEENRSTRARAVHLIESIS
jgi:hypothetical protein